MIEASRELLAPRRDVWALVSEPYHLPDWWPAYTGVRPDRRGLAPNARWQVSRGRAPGLLRRPGGEGLIVIKEVDRGLGLRWHDVGQRIDAGIGGETAHAVAETLRRLAERAQVIAITHLPQIASRADRHLRVEKVPGDPTHTRIAPLADDERRDELERMLGGREFLAALR